MNLLDRLRALHERASTDWTLEWDQADCCDGTYCRHDSDKYQFPWRIPGVCNIADEDGSRDDAELIVALRNAWPSLNEILEAAIAVVDAAAKAEKRGQQITPTRVRLSIALLKTMLSAAAKEGQ